MFATGAGIQRERVSEDIYVFTSELYVQVTAGAVITPEGAILIDTLPFPSETRQIKHFVEEEMNTPVRYVINTHYHADHTYGNWLFPRAKVVGHQLCRELQLTRGARELERVKQESHDLRDVVLVPPELVFETGVLNLHLGKRTLSLRHSPGHSPDGITVLVHDERVLFAGDTLMPVPFIVDGDVTEFIRSLKDIPEMGLENIVQGHGEIVLRGEIDDAVKSDIAYLEKIQERVKGLVAKGAPMKALDEITLESVGKSRLPLGGVVMQLHRSNLEKLYRDCKSGLI